MTDTLTTQSATPATIPASTVIATDDAGAAGHVQVVKLAISTDGSATALQADNTDGLLVNLGTNNDVTVTGSVTANAGTNLNTSTLALESGGNLAAAVTALQIIDNFISGSKGLVTEDNSASILTSLQTIDNFISGARGLVTEDNSAAILTALQTIDNFISGSRGLVTEDNSAAALTALQLIDDVIATLGTTTYTEAATKGAVIGAVRRDADTTLVDTTNEIGPLQMNAAGQLKVEVFSGETLPVSGTVTANLAAGTNNIGDVDILTIAAGDNNIGNVDIASAIPAGDNAIGRVKLTDGTDVADVLDLSNSNPLTVAIVDGSGDQITSFGGGTQYTEAATDTTITGTAILWEDGSDTLRVPSAAKPLPVEIIAGGGTGGTSAADDADFTDGTTAGTPAMGVYESTPTTVTDGDLGVVGITEARRLKTSATIDAALPAGTNNIGDVDVLSSALPTGAATSAKQDTVIGHLDGVETLLGTIDTDTSNISTKIDTLAGAVSGTEMQVDVLTIAAGDNNIGNVDIASIAAGDNNIGNVDVVTLPNVTLAAGTNTNEVVGDVAHDAGVGGNPVLIAGVSQDMDDTAPPNTVNAEADATRLATDRDGALFTHPHGPRVWSYHLDTSTAQTDTAVHAAPASGLSLYVTDIVFSSVGTAAMNLFFEEGSTKVLGPYYLPATAGGVRIQFQTPKKITAATALTLTTSASQAHSVDITGFTAQG